MIVIMIINTVNFHHPKEEKQMGLQLQRHLVFLLGPMIYTILLVLVLIMFLLVAVVQLHCSSLFILLLLLLLLFTVPPLINPLVCLSSPFFFSLFFLKRFDLFLLRHVGWLFFFFNSSRRKHGISFHKCTVERAWKTSYDLQVHDGFCSRSSWSSPSHHQQKSLCLFFTP